MINKVSVVDPSSKNWCKQRRF